MTWTGKRLREARARRGWTQARAAEQLGAAVRSWAAWERDEAKPQAHWVAKLDDLFADTTSTDQDRLDPATIDAALDQADFLELLAAIARRYARDTNAATPSTGTPLDVPPGRYVWHNDDAPSARRARAEAMNPDHPDDASGGRTL